MSIVGNLRLRYVFGLSAIAGLTNRIAYFVSLMAATDDETEFNQARSQVGLTIHKMQACFCFHDPGC